MIIELKDKNNLEDILNIWLEVNVKTHFYIEEEYWISNYEYVKKLLPKADLYAYESSGEFLGFIGIMNKNYVAGIFILNDFQSQGIGNKLLKRCKGVYKYLTLHVYSKNIRAIDFYLKNEFKIIEETVDELTGELQLKMEWIGE